MYSLDSYGAMVADRIRMDAYVQALRMAVKPGSVVVDIGTGPGILAVLACQMGARRVFAIESSPIIQLAREIAVANGYADKIEFFEDISTQVTLPIRADVIVSDLHGVLPLFERHIPSIADARRRFLSPGGTLIPHQEKIWVAVVESPERYADIVDPWERNELGTDLRPATRIAVNTFRRMRFTRGQLLTKPQLWATLDYQSVENSDIQAEVDCQIERDGTGHGIAVWFDAKFAEGVGFSNAPGEPETIYGSVFFPWPNPVPLAAGQTVRVDLKAKLLDKDYFWRWSTRIAALESPENIIAHFDQSQLQGTVMSLAELHRAASDFVPVVSEEGRIQKRTLDLMDGKASLEDIAKRLVAEFPQRFSHWHRALSYAGSISRDYCR